MRLLNKNLLYAIIICLGPYTVGNITAYTSPTAQFIRKHHNLPDNAIQWSIYNGAASLFAIVGPFLTEFILRMFHGSRRKTAFFISVFGTFFWLFNLTVHIHIWAGIAARACLGLILGAYSALSPMYLVEIAPDGASGFYGSMNQLTLVFASIILNVLGPTLDYLELSVFCACFPLLESALIWFVPEPKGAKKEDESESNAPKESIFQRKYIPGLSLGILMMFFQQFSGITAVVTNLADIMTKSGLDFDACYQAAIAQFAQCVAVFVGGILIDKLGRRMVWLASSLTIVIFLLIFALNDKFQWHAILPLISIFLYEFGFGIGFGPIPWFIIPEYFDDSLRSLAQNIVTSFNYLFTFIIVILWPVMQNGLGMFGSFIFFMVISIGAFIYGFFMIQEPKAGIGLIATDIPLAIDAAA